jgi:hypothetical protein
VSARSRGEARSLADTAEEADVGWGWISGKRAPSSSSRPAELRGNRIARAASTAHLLDLAPGLPVEPPAVFLARLERLKP